MTENEKVEKYFNTELSMLPEESLDSIECEEIKNICLKALEEIQAYRAIEQRLKSISGKNERIFEMIVNGISEHKIAKDRPIKGVKIILITDNDIDNTEQTIEVLKRMKSQSTTESSINALRCAIGAVKKVEECRAIGTIEEFKALKEKSVAKKPIAYKNTNGADCPCCGARVRGIKEPWGNWCSKCGQKLDWSE